MAKQTHLIVENYGPIRKVDVPFADITVLVGPQATGKSLVLQWLKLALDQSRILGTLETNGFDVAGEPERLAGWYFGAGYEHAWHRAKVEFGTSLVDLPAIARRRKRHEAHHALFVPAHRALVFATGWPQPFRSFTPDTPYVVREFSENVRQALSGRETEPVFPAPRRFRQELRESLDHALFHGGRVMVESQGLGGKQLRLVHGNTNLATMEWTTGQREVVPLIVSLSSALPFGPRSRTNRLDWVIVEEPELGLHPDGIMSVVALLLEVAARGYRLVLSTHSSVVLEVLWVMNRLQGREDAERRLLRMLGLPENLKYSLQFARKVLGLSTAITYFDYKRNAVESADITSLDPSAGAAAEADWGGLIRYSSRSAEVLSE